jgi:predicted transcriptional regulator
MKKRINISLDEETVEKLKELAEASHKNVSQWISDAVWSDERTRDKEKDGNE